MVKPVLIVGATGSQGGAVADRLLENPEFEVHALTRSPDGNTARSLRSRGASVVEGDLDDLPSIRTALEDVDAVFGLTDYFDTNDPEGERRQGIALAELADEAAVDHVVYSSALGADRDSGLPHFESKYGVERRLRELDVDHTVVRPAPFMQNLEEQRSLIEAGLFAQPLATDVSVPLLDVEDEGLVVEAVLSSPDRYVGEDIDLVGGVYSTDEAGVVISDVTGTPITTLALPRGLASPMLGSAVAEMYAWFETEPVEWGRVESVFDDKLTSLEGYLVDASWDGSSWRSHIGHATGYVRPTV